MKTVIVTGGRDYDDFAMVADVLEALSPERIVQGGALGADQNARRWAEASGVECVTVEADWDKHGKAAGPIRNREMLERFRGDSLLVAFPGGKGTENCVKTAVALNYVVLRVEK